MFRTLFRRIVISLIATLLVSFLSCEENDSRPDHFRWEISTPEAENMMPALLDSAVLHADRLGYVDGLVVIRNGKLVLERYFNGYGPDAPHNVKSVSKSFLSALTGIALREGFIDSLDEKVMNYFPEYVYAGMDARKYDITLRHLLTMRMGIIGEEAVWDSILHSPDWIKSTIGLPLLSSPGEKFRYSTFQTHLLSAILTKASGKSSKELANEYLLRPMGITLDDWLQDPQGYYFGGSDMYFTPREMAAFGYLYLLRGNINNRQIVPVAWTDSSFVKTWKNDAPEWGVLKDYNYGYLWWLGKINNYQMHWALGFGGQTILIFPEMSLIVVTTAGYDIGWNVDQERPILELVSKYILPSVNG